MGMARALVWSVGLTAILGAASAAAQPLPVADENESSSTIRHRVTLRGASPGIIWEIHGPEGPIEDATPLARCGERGCVLAMPPGQYRLWFEGAAGDGPRGYKAFTITQDTDVTVRAPRKGQKAAGLTLAIGGKVALVTGMTLTTLGAVGDCDCPIDEPVCDCDSDPDLVSAGLVTMLAGIIAIPVGWVTFAKGRKPTFEFREPAQRAPAAPPNAAEPQPPQEQARRYRLQVGPQQMGSGLGLGTRVTF